MLGGPDFLSGDESLSATNVVVVVVLVVIRFSIP